MSVIVFASVVAVCALAGAYLMRWQLRRDAARWRLTQRRARMTALIAIARLSPPQFAGLLGTAMSASRSAHTMQAGIARFNAAMRETSTSMARLSAQMNARRAAATVPAACTEETE